MEFTLSLRRTAYAEPKKPVVAKDEISLFILFLFFYIK
jgi:hypothetical protein